MNAAIEQSASVPVWAWYFATPRDLQRGLEEYTAFQGDRLVRQSEREPVDPNVPIGAIDLRELERIASRYGLRLSTDEAGAVIYGTDGNPVLEEDPDAAPRPEDVQAIQQMHSAQRRAEIDACLEAIRRPFPHWYKLLDTYYREGLSLEPRGWAIAAHALGAHQVTCPPLKRCPASPGEPVQEDRPDCRKADKICRADRARFEVLLAIAIARLFDAHRVRREKCS
jgi:hypothetical protein